MKEFLISSSYLTISFSYGRALQNDALNAWSGSNRIEGQKALLERSNANSNATFGNSFSIS